MLSLVVLPAADLLRQIVQDLICVKIGSPMHCKGCFSRHGKGSVDVALTKSLSESTRCSMTRDIFQVAFREHNLFKGEDIFQWQEKQCSTRQFICCSTVTAQKVDITSVCSHKRSKDASGEHAVLQQLPLCHPHDSACNPERFELVMGSNCLL